MSDGLLKKGATPNLRTADMFFTDTKRANAEMYFGDSENAERTMNNLKIKIEGRRLYALLLSRRTYDALVGDDTLFDSLELYGSENLKSERLMTRAEEDQLSNESHISPENQMSASTPANNGSNELDNTEIERGNILDLRLEDELILRDAEDNKNNSMINWANK